MATSAFDRTTLLTALINAGPFHVVLFDTAPATNVDYASLTTKASYPSYADHAMLIADFSGVSDNGTTSSASNSADITFPSPSADGTHDLQAVGLYDNAGKCRRLATISTAIPLTGATIQILAGVLVVSQT